MSGAAGFFKSNRMETSQLKVFRKYLVEFEARKGEERHHMNFHIHIYK